MPRPPAISHDILNAALAGLEASKKTIEQHILQVQSLLGTAPKRRGRPPQQEQATGGGGDIPTPFKESRKKFSAATRKRMAQAQRKRYAALRPKASASTTRS